MDTFKIKALLAAIKYKSLSKAANEFSYTPSAFSHMADAFEEELGVRLLKRTSAGVEMSEDGKILYEKLCAVLDAEAELISVAKSLSDKKEEALRIGTYSSISMYLLPELLTRFKKEHPEIKISIAIVDSLVGWLEQDKADIILADSTAFGKNKWFPIKEDPYVVVAPRGMLGDRISVRREELYGYPRIFTNEPLIDEYLDNSKFKESIYLDAADDISVISMIREGMGLAILPSFTLEDDVRGVDVLTLEPEITRTLGVAYKKSVSASTAKFISFLKRTVGQQ